MAPLLGLLPLVVVMSKRPWDPLPEEADLFCNVYVDESSWTKFRYFVLGGLVVPLSHAALFEADIVAAREKAIVPACRADGTPRVMKWEKVYSSNFDAYRAVIDTAFHFRTLRNLPARKELGLHCLSWTPAKKRFETPAVGTRRWASILNSTSFAPSQFRSVTATKCSTCIQIAAMPSENFGRAGKS